MREKCSFIIYQYYDRLDVPVDLSPFWRAQAVCQFSSGCLIRASEHQSDCRVVGHVAAS